MNVGVIGSGQVGRVLGKGFVDHGHSVMCASRDPSKLDEWRREAGDAASVGTLPGAAAWADLVVLAVKGTAAEEAVRLCGPDALVGKTVIDATNPSRTRRPRTGSCLSSPA